MKNELKIEYTSGYNLEHLKNLINDCKNITDRDKEFAIEDLEFIEESPLYADRVNVQKNNPLINSFEFNKSILGARFWAKIYYKINK
jgi:hypothetical protein